MCPVSAAAWAISATAATGMTAVAVGVVAGAATGALIGVGANAAMNLAMGKGAFDGAGKAAMFGALGGGFSAGVGSLGSITPVGSDLFGTLANISPYTPSGWSIAAGGALGALIPSAEGYTPVGAYNQQSQALNMNTNIATTGSGGRQATKSLATAIARTKKRKLTQDDVGDLSLSTESFTNTGLQLA